jgi:cytochrome c
MPHHTVSSGELSLTIAARIPTGALQLAALLTFTLSATASRADDSEPGRAQFLKSCGTCHAVESDAPERQGPNLGTAFGRTAGTMGNFQTYSEALKNAGAGGLVWDEVNLDKWLTAASDLVPNSNMFYSQPDSDKRKLIIGYLKGLSGAAK